MTVDASSTPQEPTLPDLVRAAAAVHPHRIAVRDDDGETDYAAFTARVDRIVSRLVRLGCAPGTRVVSGLRRGIDAVVAQMAIMAAGGVYVPVDGAYPADLIEGMFLGARPAFVIAEPHVVRSWQSVARRHGAEIVGVPHAAHDDAAVDQIVVRPEMGAYLIHTSGSTGRPKGVLVSHGAIVRSTLARTRHYPEPVQGFLMVSPMTFDSSMAGIWWTLSQGGTLVLAHPDPATVVTRVRRLFTDPDPDVSHTLLTPSLYSRVLDGLGRVEPALRQVVVAGEVCPAELVAAHFAIAPAVALVNEYGPTEAGVWCTAANLASDADVVIGEPIGDMEILIMDGAGRPVPDGREGELYIGGPQLADGYPADPDLTRDRFVSIPASRYGRMYRSGDLGRRRPDGAIELAGRTDDQVKIRGHRIDLGGVAAQIRRHPDVADAVAAVRRRGGAGQPLLTAYVVPPYDQADASRSLSALWTQVVDDVSVAGDRGSDFDTSGWTSSYTHEAIPPEDMVEWLDATVDLIRERSPQTVLDLGCGTGMPLLRVAAASRRYVGVDVSQPTLDRLRIAVDLAGLRQVELRRGEAADVREFAGADFDLVVSNSVSQYFPDGDYLRSTVADAYAAIGRSGRVVISDVRDRTLLRAFHARAVLAQATTTSRPTDLRARFRRRVADESQLLVDPAWFVELAADLGGFVEVRLRVGRRRNEMNDFRYDAILYRQDAVHLLDVDEWSEWNGDRDVRTWPAAARPGRIAAVRNIANARTCGASAIAAMLDAGHAIDGRELRSIMSERDAAGVHPDDVRAAASAAGLGCVLSRAAGHPSGAFDAVFVPPQFAVVDGKPMLPRLPTVTAASAAARTNQPARQRIVVAARSALVPVLRHHAATVLPDYERPAAYVVLAELPVTANGKLDIGALPDPWPERPDLDTPFAAPVTWSQRAVAAVWSELLGLADVGIDDEFTELGGDSLLNAHCAVLLVERIGRSLPAGASFAATTVRALAAIVDALPDRAPTVPARVAGGDTAVDVLPLTSAQTAFWFLDHYRRPGGSRHPDFAMPVHYRISGRLDVGALRSALDALVDRHEALRARILLEAGEGSQILDGGRTHTFVVRRTDSDDPESALQEAAKTDQDAALDPATGRNIAVMLVSAAPDEHLLILRVHHMAADGWSMSVIERELGELYRGALQGNPSIIPDAPDYRTHVRTMDETFFTRIDWRDDIAYRDTIRYWSEQADGVAPIRLTGPPSPGTEGTTSLCSVLLSETETRNLDHVVRRRRATLFSALLAVLANTIAADFADPDVRLLTLAAARDTPDLERMVGLLLSPLLLRTPVIGSDTFGGGLQRAAALVREALAHGRVPLLALCEEIPDLMALMTESQFVAVESLPEPSGLRLGGCTIRRSDPFDDDFAGSGYRLPVDLLVVARPEGARVRIAALFDPASFDGSYIRRLLDRVREALARGAADPDLLMSALTPADPAILADQEQHDE